MNNNTSMHFCLEAKDDNNDTVYLIYEVNYTELLSFYEPRAPLEIFNQVAIIRGGVPSMGCGVFNSKIVLAGGIGKRKNGESNRHKGVITYDIISQEVSKEDIPSMRGCKVNPLVFQLNNKLFVFDTYFKPHRRSFEVYYPKQNIWHNLRIPYFTAYSGHVRAYSSSGGISRYSCFPFGDCFYVSLPKDYCAYFHHAKDSLNRSIMASAKPLPFRGMATTYYQEGFNDDVVVISFSNGLVEGRRFVMPDRFSENPVLILDTKKRSGYKKEMTGCFADLGGGNFCLTTFDKEYIHIYVFMIHRSPCENGEDLNLEVRQSNLHKYRYEDFSGKGCQSFKFSGCFAPLGNDRIKEKVKAEAALHCRDFPFWGNKKDIDVPGVPLSQYNDVDDTDSDYYGESDYDYSHYNA